MSQVCSSYGEYLASAFGVLLLSGGEALEAYALRRARSSLSANTWQGDQLISIPAGALEVCMEIFVNPGELNPFAGFVTFGSSCLSEADLTGEPVPVHKTPGMLALSGGVNLDCVLEIRVSRRVVAHLRRIESDACPVNTDRACASAPHVHSWVIPLLLSKSFGLACLRSIGIAGPLCWLLRIPFHYRERNRCGEMYRHLSDA